DPRQEVFTEAGCRGNKRVVITGNTDNQRREVFCQGFCVKRIVGHAHATYPGEPGSLIDNGCDILTGHQDFDSLAEFACSGNCRTGCGTQTLVIVLGNNQCCHNKTLASLRSFSTNSCTLATIIPGARAGGSSTLSNWSLLAASTPSSANGSISKGFFLACIRLGSFK